MAKKIAAVLALAGALFAGANAYAQNKITDNSSPSYSKNLEAIASSGKVISTFTLPSVRKGYEGKPFTYEVLVGTDKNGKEEIYARRKDEPQTIFLLSAFYDIGNKKAYGMMQDEMIKRGIPMNMTKDFVDKVLVSYAQYIRNQNFSQNTAQQAENIRQIPERLYLKPTDVSLMTPKPGTYNGNPNSLPLPEIPAQASSSATTASSPVSTNDLEFILDASTSGDAFGGRAGLRWKISGMFGLGFTASGMYGLPQTVSSSKTDPSPTGRYFEGSIINDNRIKASLDIEASLGDKNGGIFTGIGPMILLYNEKTSEKIKDASGSTVKSNYNSEMKLTPGIEGYVGYSIKGFRVAVTYDSSGKFFGELGVSIPYNNPKDKK
ncbi:MAG TPA: hypothetical protein VMC07_01500 [Candidatus Omnitrophota bacterium]|nr:hypothetical protein [Candidatus Omnitrophota bacterium]